MYIRKNHYENAIQRIRINLGTALGLAGDEEAFITLKEMPTLEMMEMRDAHAKGEKELLQFFRKVLPLIIVDHSFYEDEKTRMKNEDIASFIFESLELTSQVINGYTNASFFTRRNGSEGR